MGKLLFLEVHLQDRRLVIVMMGYQETTRSIYNSLNTPQKALFSLSDFELELHSRSRRFLTTFVLGVGGSLNQGIYMDRGDTLELHYFSLL